MSHCENFQCVTKTSTNPGRLSDYQVDLSWNLPTDPKVTGYTIRRNNTIIGSVNSSINFFNDFKVPLMSQFRYVLQALSGTKVIEESQPAFAQIPNYNLAIPNETSERILCPVNLGSLPVFYNGYETNKLTWTLVPGAIKYKIYRYDELIGETSSTFFYVPQNKTFGGFTYTVTSVAENGNESYPSALARSRGRRASASIPEGIVNGIKNIEKYSEVNDGSIRNVISWRENYNGQINTSYYNVLKDDVIVAEGLWVQYFIDPSPTPGKNHTYKIINVAQYGNTFKTTTSEPIQIQTLSSTSLPSTGVVSIISVIPNDDTLKIKFQRYPGAKDYKCYVQSKPHIVKYSGNNDIIEMNGIGRNTTATLIIEALDKLGPWVKMDGYTIPGHYSVGVMSMDSGHDDEPKAMGNHWNISSMYMTNAEVNGQGDPSNAPNVIAQSAPFQGTTQDIILTGEQQFFEPWRSVKPFKFVPSTPELDEARKMPGTLKTIYYKIMENDRWKLFFDDVDTNNSQFFWMASHMMETVYDGGTVPYTDAAHVNKSTLMMIPKQTANISGGKVLHAFYDVDAFFTGRRWVDMLFWPSGDMLISGKDAATNLTTSNNTLRWGVFGQFHQLSQSKMVNGVFERTRIDLPNIAEARSAKPYPSYAYTKYNDKTKYKIGEFTITSVNDTASTTTYNMSINYFASDNRFTPTTSNRGLTFVKKGNIVRSEWGNAYQRDLNLATFNVKIEPNFTQNSPTYVNKNLGYILDAYNNVRYGSISYEKTSSSINPVRGNVYFRPGPQDDNLAPNRNEQWYDSRIKFEIYFSTTRVMFLENDYLVADVPLLYPLPFESITMAFNHHVYHTSLELDENSKNGNRIYHYNHRPFADERHWDNMGFEVLTDFPIFFPN